MAQDDSELSARYRGDRERTDVRHGYERGANKIQKRHRMERKGDAFGVRQKQEHDECDEPYRAVRKEAVHVIDRGVGKNDVGNGTTRALCRVAYSVVNDGDTRCKKEHRVKNREANLLLTGVVLISSCQLAVRFRVPMER